MDITIATATTATTTTSARTTASGTRQPGRSKRARLLTLVAPLLLLAAASPVDAYTITSRQSVPTAPTVFKVQGRHYDIGSQVTGPMLKPWLYQRGPTVSRVNGSGSQTVSIRYDVYRWNGSSWASYTSASGSVTIAANASSASAPALSLLPNAGAGYYHVQFSLTWTSQIGGVLGSFAGSMNQTGDYSCNTTRTCSTGQGWVYIGS